MGTKLERQIRVRVGHLNKVQLISLRKLIDKRLAGMAIKVLRNDGVGQGISDIRRDAIQEGVLLTEKRLEPVMAAQWEFFDALVSSMEYAHQLNEFYRELHAILQASRVNGGILIDYLTASSSYAGNVFAGKREALLYFFERQDHTRKNLMAIVTKRFDPSVIADYQAIADADLELVKRVHPAIEIAIKGNPKPLQEAMKNYTSHDVKVWVDKILARAQTSTKGEGWSEARVLVVERLIQIEQSDIARGMSSRARTWLDRANEYKKELDNKAEKTPGEKGAWGLINDHEYDKQYFSDLVSKFRASKKEFTSFTLSGVMPNEIEG